ncbi:MAG: hypothetical protein R2867_30655 [Caldilineaceae bacterium]
MQRAHNEYQHLSFRAGNFECTIVNDGSFTYPQPVNLFDEVPNDRLGAALCA